MQQPRVKDKEVWLLVVLEHRRQLLERLIAAFPEVLTTKRSAVESYRNRLNSQTPANS